MPTAVGALFDGAGISRAGSAPWGNPVTELASGVYVVTLGSSIDGTTPALADCPVSPAALETWLDVRPELRLDGLRPTPDELAVRLSALWLPDEVILYVGKATSLAARIHQYYATPLGARRPHAGGHVLKTLSNLDDLHVHFGTSSLPAETESLMLEAFCAGVSESTREVLHDPDRPLPFANLEWPPGTRKRHGITGGKEPRVRAAPP